jgi:hypothetical protein
MAALSRRSLTDDPIQRLLASSSILARLASSIPCALVINFHFRRVRPDVLRECTYRAVSRQ